jgi:hypothetical protein
VEIFFRSNGAASDAINLLLVDVMSFHANFDMWRCSSIQVARLTRSNGI